jgi:pimeloyl-ACP methyl ester carboxylesterase
MLARYARRFLVIEFAIYGLAAATLHELGLVWPAALAVIPGFAILARCVGVGATFIVAAALSAADRGTPLSLAGRLRLVAVEIFSTTMAYSVLMPFPRAFGRPDSRLPPRTAALPVLLVHGYLCNSGIWASMRRFLEKNGVSAYTHDLEPVYAGIDEYAAGLATRIEEICDRSGANRVIIVGHSMGGLAARAYLRARGPARVVKLITLGTPHHGTRTAPLGLGMNARQMEPGSAWLESLARWGSSRATVPVTSIYSSDDNVIVPPDSSVLGQARNVRLSGIGHVSLPFSRIVQETVLEEIKGV